MARLINKALRKKLIVSREKKEKEVKKVDPAAKSGI